MFAPPRNAFAFLTSCSVLDERDFALCGARPKGSALWTSAAFEKAGETFPWRLRRLKVCYIVRCLRLSISASGKMSDRLQTDMNIPISAPLTAQFTAFPAVSGIAV